MRYENPASGEVVEVLSESDELLVMQVTWPRPGHRAVAHVHPGMQERWQVVEGRAAFEIDGVETRLAPGEDVVAEAGQRHLAWNPTDEKVVLRIEMRPALRWVEFVRRPFGGEPPLELLKAFPKRYASDLIAAFREVSIRLRVGRECAAADARSESDRLLVVASDRQCLPDR